MHGADRRPTLTVPPASGVPHLHSRRLIDRAMFWYLLMLLALVLLLVSFWVWNSDTATQSGLSTIATRATS